MSYFSWNFDTDVKISESKIDINKQYKDIGKKFVDTWTNDMKTNIYNATKYFEKHALCTFITREYVGYDKMYNSLTNDFGISKLLINVRTQTIMPRGNNGIYIMITGTVSTESSKIEYRVFDKSYCSFFHLIKRKNDTLYVTHHAFTFL